MEADVIARYTATMLRIEAHNMTAEELEELRRDHDIVDRPGFVTILNARKVDDAQIVWSMRRMKEGYWHTLQAQKKAETCEVVVV